MSKLSYHITQPGTITGIGDALKKCATASPPSPVGIIYVLNSNFKPTLTANSPTTKLIYRRQSAIFNRLPGDFYVGDPVQSATQWLSVARDPQDQNRTLFENWSLNPADYHDPLNEAVIELQNPNDPIQVAEMVRRAQWLNTWMVTALNLASQRGFPLALFSFPTGSPTAQAWPYLYPALRLGKQLGAVLSLHEYSVIGTMQNPQPGNVLRYRTVWNSLPLDCRIPIVITECSAGNGYDTGLSGQSWVNDMAWYDSELMKDTYLLGGCAFQLGGDESNLFPVLGAYSTYIAAHPTAVLPIVEESPDGTTVPPAVKIVDSDMRVWTLGDLTPMGYKILKDGVQFAGGQAVLLVYYGDVYAKNNQNQWYMATALKWIPANDPMLQESPDNTIIPPAPQIVDSALSVWKFGAVAVHGYVLLKNGTQFAGGQGVLLLYYGKKIYTKNDLNQWYVATATTWQSVAGDPRPPAPVVKAEGIDVSHYQLMIDWPKVKAAGKLFAFIKATESNYFTDSQFSRNWASAKAAGLLRGAYHFYRFGVTPQSQVDRFLSVVGSDLGELPLVVDVEDTQFAHPSPNDLKTFIDLLQQRTGRKPIIYTASWYWNTTRWGSSVPWAKDYDLWAASYTTSPLIPSDWSSVGYKFWQYTSSGVVNGITVATDLNKFNGTEAELRAYATPIQPPPPIPQPIKFGLGAGTQDEIPQSHADLYGRGFGTDVNACFKFLTLPDAGAMTRSITKIKAKNPNAFLMARIFFSVGNTPFTAQDFVNYSNNGTASAYANGIRDFEIGNEWNIEGMNLNWHNGVEFGNWLKIVIGILKVKYPNARWWMPALSPNDGAPQFMIDTLSTEVGSLVYGYSFHSYWYTESGGQWNMNDETGGLSWKKIWRVLPASEQKKPICLSEFSCNSPTVSLVDKGKMYKKYRTLLQNNGVHSALSFVLYWQNDTNHENWANLNGSSTGIVDGYLGG